MDWIRICSSGSLADAQQFVIPGILGLKIACSFGRTDIIVDLIIRQQVVPTSECISGLIPKAPGHIPLLISAGASFDFSCLCVAVGQGNVELCRWILTDWSIDPTEEHNILIRVARPPVRAELLADPRVARSVWVHPEFDPELRSVRDFEYLLDCPVGSLQFQSLRAFFRSKFEQKC